MADWNKPLPTVSGESKPYWDSCRLGRLVIQKCDNCSEFQFYLMISNGILLLAEALCGPLQLPIKIEPLGLRKMYHMY